ncbi:MAG: hypothetical protein KF908_10415 [Nitrosomonas sp.]|uniref:Uncharacterized protein n=1 Tax=Nitrosomonas aestuarii TaxID=52441 RepID=A0A1I4DNZ7_9PROT|nr:hypothetical protein [Nitrosomonas aestuarii]MBX3630297.1 hypothetical protein [Nitrosomonas sp.]SFK93671.1 hypothetical protein SAMN05216302_102185 [Nitrosomonas aestuarii]
MRAHIITWLLSVVSAVIVGVAWVYTHPVPKLVQVDLVSLFQETAAEFASRQDESVTQDVQRQAVRIDMALQQLADTCQCDVINSAAIVKRPGKAHMNNSIPDMTAWVRDHINGR